MRLRPKAVASIVLASFAVVCASGCAGGAGTGTSVTPIAPLSRGSYAAQPNERAARKVAQWLQFGYDAGHSGYNPLEKSIGHKNVSKLRIAWNDKRIIQPGGIAVADNVVYVDDMGQTKQGLYAIDAATGAKKWYANVRLNGSWGAFTHAVPVVAGNVIVTPCSNGSSSAFLTGLCGVDAKNGKILWKTYCQEYQGSPCGGLNSGTSPAFDGKLVYFQSTQGVNEQPDTQALDPKTGKIVWDVAGVYHCPDAGDSSANPLPVSNGLVFAVLGCQSPSYSTEICGFSTTAGKAAWCDASPTAYIEDLIAGGGKLYVVEPGDSGLEIVAFDAGTGARMWAASLPGGNFSALATANGRLFVSDGGAGVYALSANSGKQLWSYTANANLFVGGVLSVANGIVYADGGGGNNGNVAITAFNAKNGSVIWTSGSIGNGGARATPAIVNGAVYAGCYTLCSFTLPHQKP